MLSAAGLTLAPLVVKVNPNVNVVLTACLAVYVGCYRSVKPTPPTVSGAPPGKTCPHFLYCSSHAHVYWVLIVMFVVYGAGDHVK